MKKRRLIKVILKLQYQISGVYWNYKENSGNPSKLRGETLLFGLRKITICKEKFAIFSIAQGNFVKRPQGN